MKKFLGWALFLVVAIFLVYIFLGSIKFDFECSAKDLKNGMIEIKYKITNNSIADLTIPRNTEKNLSVNYRIYNDVTRVLEDSNKENIKSREAKILKKGETLEAFFTVKMPNEAKYVELYIEPQSDLIKDTKEKCISFIRKDKIKTDKVEIKI